MKSNQIVCPVDYSKSTELAISLAADLAKVNRSKIVLLHVVEPNSPAISVSQSIDNRLLKRLREQYLDLHDVEHEHLTLRGDPAEVTLEYAKRIAADLIVMGTQGRTGIASLVVGSVARKVMAGAHCPVVTVKTPPESKVDS